MSTPDIIVPAPVDEKAVNESISDRSGSEDVEKHGVGEAAELHRTLKSRHLQMIAIGKLMFKMSYLLNFY